MLLRRFDLNLLVIFDVLMQERNITRSAAKLHMSQPAVSHALGRLRKQVDDPLLVRCGDTMEASPRALELYEELHNALGQIENSLTPRKAFDPATSDREFYVATTDYVEALLLPPLLRRIQEEAPGIRLHIRHLASHIPFEDIEKGNLDLAIGMDGVVPKRFRSRLLMADGYRCAMTASHPLAGKSVSAAEYANHEHLVVAPESKRKEVGQMLYPKGKKAPKIVANIPHFLAALDSIRDTTLLLTGPRKLLEKFEKPFGLYLSDVPFKLPPFEISAVWHNVKSADQGLNWLKQTLADVASQ